MTQGRHRPAAYVVTRIRDGRAVLLLERSQLEAEQVGARWLGVGVDSVIAYRDEEPALPEE